jgi:SAM-dependent methyltransferase
MNNSDVKYIHIEEEHNTRAAQVVVPELMRLFKPDSVLDVGCGIGTWLHVFGQQGVRVVKGIDGDYVDRKLLGKYLKVENFVPHDLSKPFSLGQKFDLVMSLEVAEHLPASAADNFVKNLVDHGDDILFSAALPGQDGQNHLNEQWPDYWAAKFNAHGYRVYDVLRPLFWNDQRVDRWYRQNMLLYSKRPLPFPETTNLNVVLPDYWHLRNEKLSSLENQLKRIRDGKVGLGFYVKSMFKSLKHLGRKTR